MSFQPEYSPKEKAVVTELARLPGSPLEPQLRAYMEEHFARKLDKVRLHTGPRADNYARSLGARAFTWGSHIVFAAGRYKPDTDEGLWLLAHELAHFIQQSRGMADEVIDAPLSLLEREADRVADIIAAGGSLRSEYNFGKAPFGAIQLRSAHH